MKKIIIAILTLTIIVTVFASCTKTEIETTTNPPVIEFPTEEVTSDEVTTEVPITEEVTTNAPAVEESTTEVPTTEVPTTQAPETTTKAPETTTKVPETTTKPVETTTKAPETTTKAPETTTKPAETTTKAPEPTTEKNNSTNVQPWEDPTYDDTNLNVTSIYGCSPIRAGLIYTSTGYRTTYDKLAEGETYFQYDENGYKVTKVKPYTSGNEPVIDRDHCADCGKKTPGYDGKHLACYYGYCTKFMRNMNCPECGEYVPAHTCHTCKK